MRSSRIFNYVLAASLLLTATLQAQGQRGPYAPEAGAPGSTAIAHDDARIAGWVRSVETVSFGLEVDTVWQDTSKVMGPAAHANTMDVTVLGRGGSITLAFDIAIFDGPGPDFAVFENAINDGFLELAFVEVSSNGTDFVRFPSISLTEAAVAAFGIIDPTKVHNLAGKYRIGFGTPFDLADLHGLEGAARLDFENIRFVRIVDVVGDGSARDSSGRVIYDPYPTIGSAGFDLAGVAVLHPLRGTSLAGGSLQLHWRADAGIRFSLEQSTDLGAWAKSASLEGDGTAQTLSFPADGPARFFRLMPVSE